MEGLEDSSGGSTATLTSPYLVIYLALSANFIFLLQFKLLARNYFFLLKFLISSSMALLKSPLYFL